MYSGIEFEIEVPKKLMIYEIIQCWVLVYKAVHWKMILGESCQ